MAAESPERHQRRAVPRALDHAAAVAAHLRCVWSFRCQSPDKYWRVPLEPSQKLCRYLQTQALWQLTRAVSFVGCRTSCPAGPDPPVTAVKRPAARPYRTRHTKPVYGGERGACVGAPGGAGPRSGCAAAPRSPPRCRRPPASTPAPAAPRPRRGTPWRARGRISALIGVGNSGGPFSCTAMRLEITAPSIFRELGWGAPTVSGRMLPETPKASHTTMRLEITEPRLGAWLENADPLWRSRKLQTHRTHRSRNWQTPAAPPGQGPRPAGARGGGWMLKPASHCPGRYPPLRAGRRPARPYKRATDRRFAAGEGEGRLNQWTGSTRFLC
jgi:hypothetical protein